MDPTWKEETWEAKNNLDFRAENGKPNMGRGTAYHKGSDQVEAALRSAGNGKD